MRCRGRKRGEEGRETDIRARKGWEMEERRIAKWKRTGE